MINVSYDDKRKGYLCPNDDDAKIKKWQILLKAKIG